MPSSAVPRFYVDEDPHQRLAGNLRPLGFDALATVEAGNKGLSDPRQLAFATDEARTLITCNRDDFELLHEALVLWSRRPEHEGSRAHSGILIIPSGNLLRLPEATQVIAEFARRPEADAMNDRLFVWERSTGWRELLIS